MAVRFLVNARKEGTTLIPILSPQYRFNRAMDIKPGFLRKIRAKAVLLDIDNTLALHGSQTPYPGAAEWVRLITGSGIPVMVISNNTPERVKPFADLLGVPYEANAMKPLHRGMIRACRKLGVKPSQTAVVGDQIFTDVLGGNALGAKVILTEPLGPETDDFIKFKRKIEKYIR